MQSILAVALLALPLSVLAADHTVQVGNGQFNPQTISAPIGDTVTFVFNGAGVSASEATARLSDPCNTEGGFDSGVQGSAGGSFPIAITTQNSIYVFSSPQCTQGFVMIVNPGPNDSVQQYQSVAEGSGGGNGNNGAAGNNNNGGSTSSTTADNMPMSSADDASSTMAAAPRSTSGVSSSSTTASDTSSAAAKSASSVAASAVKTTSASKSSASNTSSAAAAGSASASGGAGMVMELGKALFIAGMAAACAAVLF